MKNQRKLVKDFIDVKVKTFIYTQIIYSTSDKVWRDTARRFLTDVAGGMPHDIIRFNMDKKQ